MLTHGYLFIGNYPERTEEEELERQQALDEAREQKFEERRENGTDK